MPHVVLIAGGSGSGKTTLARHLAQQFGGVVISIDRYYRGYHEVPLPNRRLLNFDTPEAIEQDLLVSQVHGLLREEPVELPRYDAPRFERLPDTDRVEPSELIVVEGLFALHWSELRDISALSVYLETDDLLCRRRRMERDLAEFGRSAEDALLRYSTYVQPCHAKFVEPTKRHATLLMEGVGDVGELAAQVIQRASFLTMLTTA